MEIVDEKSSPVKEANASDIRGYIQAGLAAIAPHFREVVVLRYVQGLSYQRIGSILKLPEGTVKSRLYRGRQELQKLLKGLI